MERAEYDPRCDFYKLLRDEIIESARSNFDFINVEQFLFRINNKKN